MTEAGANHGPQAQSMEKELEAALDIVAPCLSKSLVLGTTALPPAHMATACHSKHLYAEK